MIRDCSNSALLRGRRRVIGKVCASGFVKRLARVDSFAPSHAAYLRRVARREALRAGKAGVGPLARVPPAAPLPILLWRALAEEDALGAAEHLVVRALLSGPEDCTGLALPRGLYRLYWPPRLARKFATVARNSWGGHARPIHLREGDQGSAATRTGTRGRR